jgi:type IV secretory pathway TraG/TraD family ATPase VirD4
MDRILIGQKLIKADKKLIKLLPKYNQSQRPISIPGVLDSGQTYSVELSNSDLSKHMLVIGGIGMGKTNGIFHIVKNIKSIMTKDDVMIIFDTKGDYIKEFAVEKDIILSNDKSCRNGKVADYWNIFNEIPGKGKKDRDKLYDNVLEISKELFEVKINNSKDPFFPNAAMQIFAGLIFNFINEHNSDSEYELNNKFLSDFFNEECNVESICEWLTSSNKTQNLCNYIDGDNGQTQGVLSELISSVTELFVGNFRKEGNISIRQAVHKRGGNTIYVKYDIASAKNLLPIYRVIIDMAIKQSLMPKNNYGNVYFILDEFRLLPKLNYLDNGINFGRSLGVKILIGMQNFNQVKLTYNEYEALSLFAGLSTIIAFRVHDNDSRKVIKECFGRNIKEIQYKSTNIKEGFHQHIFTGNVVEDWDIANLTVGEAILKTPYSTPFVFRFQKY